MNFQALSVSTSKEMGDHTRKSNNLLPGRESNPQPTDLIRREQIVSDYAECECM